MNYLLVLVLSVFLSVQGACANEVSLLETGESSNTVSSQAKKESYQPSLNVPEVEEEDEFQEMADFIQQENERLKDIKLLNLDLERASLELKKKEIEQKMAQFHKEENVMSQEDDDGVSRPSIKLLGVFLGGLKKQAVLSINGKQVNCKEGQYIEGINIASIDSRLVTVQYADGEKQVYSL
jgi:hypothetical protein